MAAFQINHKTKQVRALHGLPKTMGAANVVHPPLYLARQRVAASRTSHAVSRQSVTVHTRADLPYNAAVIVLLYTTLQSGNVVEASHERSVEAERSHSRRCTYTYVTSLNSARAFTCIVFAWMLADV